MGEPWSTQGADNSCIITFVENLEFGINGSTILKGF
jgi:hypothetical protein